MGAGRAATASSTATAAHAANVSTGRTMIALPTRRLNGWLETVNGTFNQQNAMKIAPRSTMMSRPLSASADPPLRLRHLAVRTVSPVAVEPDHAPFDAGQDADHPSVLGDRVIDGAPDAVRNQRAGAAESPR